MKTYRVDQHQINKPAKLVELPDGFEVVSNDGTIKMLLRQVTFMSGGIENSNYSTIMWIKESGGWIRVDNSQSYRSKEEFIKTLRDVEEFSQAIADYDATQ